MCDKYQEVHRVPRLAPAAVDQALGESGHDMFH